MHLEDLTPFETSFTLAFDSVGREMVVVVTKATFDFPAVPGEVCTPSLVQRPLTMADELAPEPSLAPLAETDFAPFKPMCDVLVSGRAYVPGGRPVPAMIAGIKIGPIAKVFHVIGPRVWQKRLIGYSATDPRTFTELEIGYGQAWGGVDPHPSREGVSKSVETNLSGVGYYPYREDLTGLPLPHTEEPDAPIADYTATYRPMSFGPIGRVWLPRRAYAGTYDADWQKNRMPFPPPDLDPRYYQSAPPDQQMPFLKGGEHFRLTGLSPAGDIAGILPTLTLRMRFDRKNGRLTQRVANPDTVVFYPEDRQLTITWRSHLKPDKDIFDLKQVVVSAERAA